jgi:6-phosphogluconolactonase
MSAGDVEVEATADADACAARAAAIVADAVRGGAEHIVLAGGTTPMAAYGLLNAIDLDWSAVHLWYGDERCVPFDHPDSNHGAVAAVLHAPGATWHPMPGALGPARGALAYAAELTRADARFDLVLNGMGPDGHTASLFPHHEVLQAQGLTAGVLDSPKPPPERITLTLGALSSGRRLVLLVTGAGKADALARVLAGPDPGTPSSLLARDRLLVLADVAALGTAG